MLNSDLPDNMFVGDSEMAALMRSRDWSQTPLGAIETWSDDLKLAAQILLTELEQAQSANALQQEACLHQVSQLNAFRVKLVDALRSLSDASEIQAIAARLLGETLQATRVIYTEVLSGGEEVIVHCNYTQGVAALSGRYWLEDFRRHLTADHQAGRTQVVQDIPNNPSYTDSQKAKYAEIEIAAHIDVPLVKEDQFVALLAVHSSTPRQWTETEVKLVEETAEQTWAAVERAYAEAALRESEAKYRTLFESIDEGFCIIEMLFDENDKPIDYRFLEINSIFEQQTGLQQAVGKTARQLVPDLEDFWIETYGRVALTGEPIRFENVSASMNRWFDVYAYPAGQPEDRRVALIFKDISDRKRVEDKRNQAEAALRQSEQQFRLMADAVPQIVWITDAEGRVEFFNKQWSDYTGIPYESTTAAEVATNFVHPEDSDRTVEAFAEAQRNGSIFSVEHRVRSAAGNYRWFLVRAEPYRDPHTNEVIRWFGASVDIHDRKQAEETIRQSEEQYRLLAETIPQFVWITDADGQNEYVNRRFCDYTGLTVEQMHGLNWLSILHPDDLEITRKTWLRAVNSGQFYEIEYRFRGADGGYRWFLGQGIPLKDEQGQIHKWFGTCTDIEPQKQIEQTRLQLLEQEQTAREQAETANRIKDEFLAVLSHELRSPLNPILGWTQLLQRGKLDAIRQQEALATIERNAKLQTQLIEDLLDISRIMQGKLSLTVAPVSLSFVIPAAIETVRLAAEAKHIQLAMQLDSDLALVSGDAARLQQVVWNLLTNAIKFTPSGGQVTVELRQLDQLAQVRVIDTGKGINPQFLPYVFEYFRQEDGSTTRRFGGLGLGLAIVRQIVEMHGGTVWAESEGEGQGATFIVQVPTMQQSASIISQPIHPQRETGLPLEGIQILLVDDELDTRKLQSFMLEQNGARVTAVASGLEALQRLEQFIPDVLISDIGMADMDGYMLLQQIRSRPADQGGLIPAIALTAYAAEFDRQQALAVGFQTHITKPVETEVLVEAIAKLVRTGRGPQL